MNITNKREVAKILFGTISIGEVIYQPEAGLCMKIKPMGGFNAVNLVDGMGRLLSSDDKVELIKDAELHATYAN